MLCTDNIKKTKIRFQNNFKDSIQHVTKKLMSSWQRLSGSGVGPESTPHVPEN